MGAKILIVDDNKEIREIINILLTAEGFQVDEAANGMIALDKVSSHTYDLMILDVMMPQLNGYQTCLKLREISNAPILFLSAKTQEGDKTLGFSSGGDDYLTKPFSYGELTMRVKALLRRYQIYKGKENTEDKKIISLDHLEVDESNERVLVDGSEIELTDIEYALLLLLLKNRHQIFSLPQLYQTVWNEPYYYGANNTVMVHIRNLRKKIEKDPQKPLIIKTIWGKGYRCD